MANQSGPAIVNSKYFPNSVGDTWTYAVSDSSGQVIDTLQVTVQRTTTLSDGSEARVWQYVSRDSSYTRYVVQNADSVFVYADSLGKRVKKIITPYEIHKQWNLFSHSYEIKNMDTISVANSNKIPTYHIYIYNPMQYANPISEELWMAPYVGLVKEKVYVYGSTKISHLYQLMNYNLK
ncbi:MAG TPA: hypothetical protein VJ991_06270 [Balneolales bacterium]|nr:hypothetical protein [Balneolales bacterium]